MQSSFSPDIDHELVVEAPVVKIMTQGADEHCQALEPGEFKYYSFIDALISFFSNVGTDKLVTSRGLNTPGEFFSML